MQEEIEQELTIMDEQARGGKTIGVDLLHREIADLCSAGVETLDVSATIGEAIAVMQAGNFGAVLITEGGALAGIVTERDLLMKVLGKPGDHAARPVAEIMTPNPETLHRDDEIVYLMNGMHVGGFRHMPIVDEDGRPRHIVSIRDVLEFVLDHFDDEIQNIPPVPFRGDRKRYSG